jgi:hypothetical protein
LAAVLTARIQSTPVTFHGFASTEDAEDSGIIDVIYADITAGDVTLNVSNLASGC